jgi:hypothetical protein
MYREEDDVSFNPLCPIMMDVQSTKKDLINKLNLYDQDDRYCSDEKNLKKKFPQGSVNHTIYMLQTLLACELKGKKSKWGFRFVVNLNNQIFFAKEGPAGLDRPPHYALAQMHGEIKQFPKNYLYSKGHLALSMGRIYLNHAHQLIRIDCNSGGFRPREKATVRALAIIFLCAPENMLAEHIDFDVLDNGGGNVATHRFQIDELKKIVLPKFTETEQIEMIKNNSIKRIINLVGVPPALDLADDAEGDKENLNTTNQSMPSGFSENSPRKTPVKARPTTKLRISPASPTVFSSISPMTVKKQTPARSLFGERSSYSPTFPYSAKEGSDDEGYESPPPRQKCRAEMPSVMKGLGRQLSSS